MTVSKLANFFLISFLVLLISCNTTVGRKENLNTSNDEWLGKNIQFPNELMLLEGTNLVPSENLLQQYISNRKIISIVDATCPTCILGQLNRADSLFHTFLDQEDKLIFILNVNKADSASFMVSMQPLIKAKGLILWDSNYHFETLNDVFAEDLKKRTFLLNTTNEIVLVGNPLFEPNLIDDYKILLE